MRQRSHTAVEKKFLKLDSIRITVIGYLPGDYFLECDSKGLAASRAHKKMLMILLFTVDETESDLAESSSSELDRIVHVHTHV